MDSEEETWEIPLDPQEETREVPLDPKNETREVPLEAPSDPAGETREAPSDREDVAQGTPSDPDVETLETPSDPEEETLEAPSDPEEKTREVPTDHEEETTDTAGSTELEGPVVPAHRKLPISGNIQLNNVKAHVESVGAGRRGRGSNAKFPADERGRRRRDCVDVRRQGHDGFSEEGGVTGADKQGYVTGPVNRQQAINALEMKEWRKARKKKCKVVRPIDKLVVGFRVIYKIKNIGQDGEVEKYRCQLTA